MNSNIKLEMLVSEEIPRESSQLTQAMLESQSSQDIFSQSVLRNNFFDGSSDGWSQASSQQQDDITRSYVSKPLLFGMPQKPTMISAGAQRIKPYRHFHDMQQKKMVENQQKNLLESFISLMNEFNAQIKDSLEQVKLDVSSDLKSNFQLIQNSHSNADEVLVKLSDEIRTYFKQFESDNRSCEEELKSTLQQKEDELKTQSEKILQLEKQIETLQTTVKRHQENESGFYDKQTHASEHVSQRIDELFRRLKDVSDNDTQVKSQLQHVLDQSRKINQQMECLGSSQTSCLSSITDVNQLLRVLKTSYEALETSLRHTPQPGHSALNMIGPEFNSSVHENLFSCPQSLPAYTGFVGASMNGHDGLNVSRHHATVATTTFSNDVSNSFPKTQHQQQHPVFNRPLSHFSPKPFHPRQFHGEDGKPSPTAVVLPILRKEDVTKEENPVRKDCLIESVDIFDDSDSESGQELEIVLERRASKLTVDRKRKLAEKKCPVTPQVNSKPSTPIQRSIRRYGKIKKSGYNAEFDRKAKVLVGDSEQIKCPPNKISKLPSNTTSRGTLALKRKQENVFNFASDEDIKHITDLLQTTHKNRRVRTS